ncbi:unnamed protein product [Diamesa tonsa]
MVAAVTLEELKENVDNAKREYIKEAIRLDRFYREEKTETKRLPEDATDFVAADYDYELLGTTISLDISGFTA